MITVLIIAVAIVYLIFVVVTATNYTIENVKRHAGGFLDMGYTTYENRDIRQKDVLKGLIWPILFIVLFMKVVIYSINELMVLFLILFNYKYKNSNAYKKIEKWAG